MPQTGIITANCLRWHHIDKEVFVDGFIWSCHKLWSSFCCLELFALFPKKWGRCRGAARVFTKVLENWNFWGFEWHSSICWCFTTMSVWSPDKSTPVFLIQTATDNLGSLCCSVSLYEQGEVLAVPTFPRSDQHRPRSRWLWHISISSAEDVREAIRTLKLRVLTERDNEQL